MKNISEDVIKYLNKYLKVFSAIIRSFIFFSCFDGSK